MDTMRIKKERRGDHHNRYNANIVYMINTIGKSPIQQPTRSFKGYPLPPLSEKKSYSESLRIFFKNFLKNICLSAYLFQNDRYTGPEHPLSMSTKSCHFKKDATSCHLTEDIILIRFCAKLSV